LRNDKQLEIIMEICEDCPFKSKDKFGCEKLRRPCDLKIVLRRGNCPEGKWDQANEENNK